MKVVSFWKSVTILIILFSFFFVRVSGILGNGKSDITPPSAAMEDAVKEWFSSLLGLRNVTLPNTGGGSRNHHRLNRLHTPQYVQNLYDRMASEIDEDDQISIGRRRRSLNGQAFNFGAGESRAKIGDELATIQAVTRSTGFPNRLTNGSGYTLQFNIDHLWIPDQQLQAVELVLAVDFGSLIGPPSAYSVYAYSIDDDESTPGSRARLLVSTGSLGVLDTFNDNFVTLNVTDVIVRKILMAGRRTITFEIFVAYKRSDPNGGGNPESSRDLDQTEIGNLLHLSSQGPHQPLLVLYSQSAKDTGQQYGSSAPTRRRRSATRAAPSRDWRHPDKVCQMYEWWIDLTRIFDDTVVIPEGFYAYFCGGSCRYPLLNPRWNATFNAQLRGAYNAKWQFEQAQNGSSIPSDVPEPKCVPQSYAPITIVYNVGANFVIRRLDDIVVTSCMCA